MAGRSVHSYSGTVVNQPRVLSERRLHTRYVGRLDLCKAFAEGMLGEIVANWMSQAPLADWDPYLNFIDVSYGSPAGMKTLDIQWPDSEDLCAWKGSGTGSATFTQPGCITLPHIDGFGSGQRMAHLKGDKVWILWPATKDNMLQVRYFLHTSELTTRRHVVEWFKFLKEPEIFYTRESDSFDLAPSAIHACISITTSVHHGKFYWKKSSFGLAKEVGNMMGEGWTAFREGLKERKKIRKEENKEQISHEAVQMRNEIRQAEDAREILIRDAYLQWKKEWTSVDLGRWKELLKEDGEENEEIEGWLKEMCSVLNKVK